MASIVGFSGQTDELDVFIEKKKEDIQGGTSGDVCTHNQQSIARIMSIRFGILENILNRISETIGDGGSDVKTSGYEQFAPIGNSSPISHLCSTAFLESDDEPWTGDLASQTSKGSMGTRTKKINIIFEIVSALLSSELYEYDDKKLFHVWDDTKEEFKRKIWIHCEFAREFLSPTGSSAFAEACGENDEWKAVIGFNPDIITRPQKTKKGAIQLALDRGESMIWAESWMPGPNGLARWQPKGEKTLFGVPVGILVWDESLLRHPLFESALFKDDDGKSVFTVNERKIELENIFSIMLLLEHELYHTSYGMYDHVGNVDDHGLATPKDIGIDLNEFGDSTKFYEGAINDIPGNNPTKKTQGAYTDEYGHGPKFTSLAYTGSCFIGQKSPFDMFPLIAQEPKGAKKKKAKAEKKEKTGAVKRSGGRTSDATTTLSLERCTKKGGKRKTRRRKRKTKRRKSRRKRKSKRRKRRKKRTKKRR